MSFPKCDLKMVMVGKDIRKMMFSGLIYRDAEVFLNGMRTDSLPEGFSLDGKVWAELVERMNQGDEALAGEIADNGILLLLRAAKGSEVDGLVALAEVCRGHPGGAEGH